MLIKKHLYIFKKHWLYTGSQIKNCKLKIRLIVKYKFVSNKNKENIEIMNDDSCDDDDPTWRRFHDYQNYLSIELFLKTHKICIMGYKIKYKYLQQVKKLTYIFPGTLIQTLNWGTIATK